MLLALRRHAPGPPRGARQSLARSDRARVDSGAPARRDVADAFLDAPRAMPLRGARALERIPLIPVGEDAPEVTPSTPRRAPAPTGALTRDGIFAFGILLVVALGLSVALASRSRPASCSGTTRPRTRSRPSRSRRTPPRTSSGPRSSPPPRGRGRAALVARRAPDGRDVRVGGRRVHPQRRAPAETRRARRDQRRRRRRRADEPRATRRTKPRTERSQGGARGTSPRSSARRARKTPTTPPRVRFV